MRTVSAWLDKGHKPNLIAKYRFAGDASTIPTLSEFLGSLEANEFHRDGHFIPQTSLIPGDITSYRVALVENLQRDLPTVCEEAFGQWRGIKLREDGRTEAHCVAESLDAMTRRRICALYRSDVEAYEAHKC